MLPAHEIQPYPLEPGSAHEFSTAEGLTVVTWNVGKRRGPVPAEQLRRLAGLDGPVILALQECRASVAVPADLGAHFAQSFRMPFAEGHGVVTAAPCAPRTAITLRARHREMGLATPKVALVSVYAVTGGAELMIVNVHALNFDRVGRRFVAQMEDLGARLDAHEGPVLFCGDFNTWHPARLGALRGLASARGLDEVDAPRGIGRTGGATRLGNLFLGLDPSLELDRIFYRGLALVEQEWRADLDASDHVPLLARFRFL